MIKQESTSDAKIGRTDNGTVQKIVDSGAVEEILPGTHGLLHILQHENQWVGNVADLFKRGPNGHGQGDRL